MFLKRKRVKSSLETKFCIPESTRNYKFCLAVDGKLLTPTLKVQKRGVLGSSSLSKGNSTGQCLWILDKYQLILTCVEAFLPNFRPIFLFCTSIKASGNLCFSDTFSGYRRRTLTWNGVYLNLMISFDQVCGS